MGKNQTDCFDNPPEVELEFEFNIVERCLFSVKTFGSIYIVQHHTLSTRKSPDQ